ncbi:MAG: FKBP-type peptidyl-prolyl cis-trans isomerase [Candidatus Heimdallarchaeota archaeon]|nr:FKBP-type peptidyl-prolyl cis-trans isomerase [Candidatus Heimdallarchaeota archaeon]MDH5646805.1 FKBP-type peptidyl-prolyl cis-trans isomerase [Candidatus Heimdallarchaeota archaeon]
MVKHSKLKFHFIICIITISFISINPVSSYTPCVGIEEFDVVDFAYTLWNDGTGEEIESRDSASFEVKTGQGGLIVGFYEEVLGMFIDEEKTFVIPPNKGYTDQSHNLYNVYLKYTVYVNGIKDGMRDEDCDNKINSGFVSKILKGLMWVAGIIVGIIVISAISTQTKQQTLDKCHHCKSIGKISVSEGKCSRCGNAYCRASFSKGCPECKSNSFIPHK